jgi:peptidoglycan/xylan/chitin deacetylase (PgdA/CDA1 family)
MASRVTRAIATLAVLALPGCATIVSSSRTPATPGTPATAIPTRLPRLPSVAAQDAAVRRFAGLGLPVYCGAGRGKLVALTFDDGPGPYTPLALRELRRSGQRATFFLVGTSIAQYFAWPAREREVGALGDHTMTHSDLDSLPLDAALAEVTDGRAAVLQAAGPPVDLFRPPEGRHSIALDAAVGSAGMAEILWDVDSLDSRVSPPADYKTIAAEVRRNLRPGSIVLMHENRGQTIRALREILPLLDRRGLRSVTVPELLAADPPTPAQLAAGRRGCGAERPAG